MIRMQKLTDDEVKALSRDVARLSSLLTRERENLPDAYLKDKGLRAAYLLYFVPSNLEKIYLPLRELSFHPNGILSKEQLRVLDIGSGPGTATLGALDFFSQQGKRPLLQFTAVDQVGENLKDAENLFRSWRDRTGINASLRTIRSDVEKTMDRLSGERHDIIILSNVLNELFHGDEDRVAKRTLFVKNMLHRLLATDGSCIIVEPALRETSRELLMVRDGLREERFSIYSPCLFGEKCPALENPKDWCHEDIPWDPPEIVKEIDSRIGLRKDSLKFSYLVLRKDGLSLSDIHGERSFRVVSDPLVSKGKKEFHICGPGGRRLIVRLDKDKAPSNEPFENMRRGDIVGFERVTDDRKRFKAEKETRVTIKSGR
jgi:ribosomal protein RSM22 (predicted rRNA methylase)